MAPNSLKNSDLYAETDSAEPVQIVSTNQKQPVKSTTGLTAPLVKPIQRQYQIVWRNIFIFIYLHIAAFYGLYYLITLKAQWRTVLWGN